MCAFRYSFLLAVLALPLVACQKEEEKVALDKYIYVASGQCYSGNGLTTFSATTASNQILKINASSGKREAILADYFATPASAGDSPIGIVDWNKDNLVIFVRNGNTGRLETLPKTGGIRNTFGTTPAMSAIITTAPTTMKQSPDGGLLMTRTGFVEKVNSSGVKNASVLISNNLGASCGTSNALLTSITFSATGRVIIANAAASPNNRVISVPATGATGTCDGAIPAPVATTYATALAFDKTNSKLLVAYGGNSTATLINSIAAYDYDETNGAITNEQIIYDANKNPVDYSFLLFGISAMALDESQNILYVATAISTATTVVNYAIEKLSYDASKIGSENTKVLTRTGTIPFYNYGVDTRCISAITIEKEHTAESP